MPCRRSDTVNPCQARHASTAERGNAAPSTSSSASTSAAAADGSWSAARPSAGCRAARRRSAGLSTRRRDRPRTASTSRPAKGDRFPVGARLEAGAAVASMRALSERASAVPSAPVISKLVCTSRIWSGVMLMVPPGCSRSGCLATANCDSTWLLEGCGRLKVGAAAPPATPGPLRQDSPRPRLFREEQRLVAMDEPDSAFEPCRERRERWIDQAGGSPGARLGRDLLQPCRFDQHQVAGAKPRREPAGEAVGGDVPARRDGGLPPGQMPGQPDRGLSPRAARPRSRPAPAAARCACSASPNCCIARIAMRCAARSSTARAGCSARTASANGPPPGTTMRAGPGRVASSASRCRSAGASCRLPPSLTTHIAASQIGRIGPTAGSPCSIGSSSFSGRPHPG